MQILQLDQNGVPQSWISPEKAAGYYATEAVSWTLGGVVTTLRGGINASTGCQSVLDLHPIVAVRGTCPVNLFDAVPTLTNAKLFARDRYTCAYCGTVHPGGHGLTREHIIPQARRGPDRWQNVLAACKACNSKKACRTPEEARMPMLFAPYVPTVFEDFLLRGRNITGDVHDYLISRVGRESRLRIV